MSEATPEMRATLDWLRTAGKPFHVTREKKLDCGCWVLGGWDTKNYEPAVRARACCPEHKQAVEAAMARWHDPAVLERLGDMEAYEALGVLIEEEIARRG